jgi:hypothetical protein
MNLVTSKGHCHFPRERSVLRGTKAGCAIEISHHFKSVDMCSTRPDPGMLSLGRGRTISSRAPAVALDPRFCGVTCS